MKNNLLAFFCLVFILSCSTEKESAFIPIPTEQTQVKSDMEDGIKSNRRKAWIEFMHKSAPGTDWRKLEAINSFSVYKRKLISPVNKRDGIETIIEGELSGEWLERGSKNQAGSVFDSEYDVDVHELYLISAGGTLWKGGLSGFTWQVVNQDLRFSPGLLRMIRYSEDEKRLVACISNEPFYSDDLGKTWTKADSPVSTGNGSFIRDALMLNEGNHAIYMLVRKDWWADIQLLYSDDHGESYSVIKQFSTSDPKNIALCNPNETNDVYIIEQIATATSKFMKIENGGSEIETLQETTGIGFGADGKANLAGTMVGDTLRFLTYNDSNTLYKSENSGQNWEFVGDLPIQPWDVRLFISKSNPDLLLTGGVDAYRSFDGGQNWTLINGWGEYYGDVENKLHADMMHFNEFVDIFEDPFIVISHHGGISKSYDGTLTNKNFSLVGLNVSQYYSVRTLPADDSYVFGGSQDQGFQRGLLPSSTPGIFSQVISGDYGHIVFSDEGKSLWTVYPGGWVTFYKNPKNDYLAASWTLESDNETVWIPPLMSRQSSPGNVIYIAGGNKDGGQGSYIIRLEAIQSSNGYEIIADQIDFDFLQASGGTVSAMAISPVNPNNWYVLTTNGKFYISYDNGTSFQKSANGPGSHYLYGSCILPSKNNGDLIYISGSGYSNAPVMVSYDGGLNFSDLDTGMPPTMAFALAINEEEDKLFAATETGPYAMALNQEIWYPMHGSSAPNQTYWSVEYLPNSKVVRFGTYGRGIWDFRIEEEVSGTTIAFGNTDFSLYPNPANDIIQIDMPNSSEENYHYTILDIRGQEIIRGKKSSSLISVKDLIPGVYIFKLEVGNSISTKKFIKE